jgi:hypothetical protein
MRVDDQDEVPPWERPGAVRRDCEPDRKTTCVLAQRDLARMREGLMGPAGAEASRRPRADAVTGLVPSLGSLAVWGLVLLFVMVAISSG